MVADLCYFLPQGHKVAKDSGLVVWVAQQRCGVVGRHEQCALLVEKFTVVAGNREARVEHPLRGHAAQTDNDFGTDQLKLLAQPRHARGGFFRQRVAVLGHNWPIWYKGRGGKGVAVTCAWLMLYLPVTGVLCCLAGGVAVLLTGYLPVGAVLIAALAVPVGWLQYGTEAGAVLALNAVIMVTRHWAGLQRIHRGEELQFFRPKL